MYKGTWYRTLWITTIAFAALFATQCTAIAPDIVGTMEPFQDGEFASSFASPDSSQDIMASVYPLSLDALLNSSALIVIGEVGPVYQYHDHIIYSDDGRLLIEGNEKERAYAERSGLPATDLYLTVHEVYRDDGTIAGGEQVFVRLYGHVTEEPLDTLPSELLEETVLHRIPVPNPGRYLFLLNPVPEGGAYTETWGWGKYAIDGDTLRRASTGEVLQIHDSGPITLSNLLKAAESEDTQFTPPVYRSDPSVTPAWLIEDPSSDLAGFVVTEYLSSGASDEERAWREEWVAAGGEQVLRELYELNVLLTQTEPNFLVMWSETSFKENIPLKVTIRVQNITPDEFTEKHLKGISWADLITVVEVTE